MSVIEERLPALDNLKLDTGGHDDWEHGACVMEAVAYVAGEPWSDHPKCASPILTLFCMRLNDRFDDDDRQLLKPFIPRLVGTRTTVADEQTRRWMICDWLVHEYAPALFRHLGQVETAVRFEEMIAITGAAEWKSVRSTIYEIRNEQWAKRRAASVDAAADAVAAAAADAAAGAVAVADAAAVAAAAADADADAAAGAVAAAVAVADAAAAAAAAAGAAAAADAVAAAATVADADAPFAEAAKAAAKEKKAGRGWYAQRDAAYRVLRPHYDKVYAEFQPGLLRSALGLVDRMIEVGRT